MIQDAELKELTLRMLENTRKMIEGEGEGEAKFRISANGSVASLLVRAFPTHGGAKYMALMLAVAEQESHVNDASGLFVAWVNSSHS